MGGMQFRKPGAWGRWTLVMVILTLTGGAFLTWWTGRAADKTMREGLFLRAQSVARNIDGIRLAALSGAPADATTVGYQQLKEQLAAARQLFSGCRFLYLTGRRPDGRVFFYVDSEPAGSPDESPPGQLYDDAPSANRQVFSTGEACLEGPFTDRWGTWVSAFVPVRKYLSSDIIAVLGMDVNARTWYRIARRAYLVPAAATLVMVLVILAGAVLMGKARRQPRNGQGLLVRHSHAVTILAAGILLTLVAADLIRKGEDIKRRKAFVQLAAAEATAVGYSLRRIGSDYLGGLAGFFESHNHSLTNPEFLTYTRYLLEWTGIRAWEWVPRVPAGDASHMEADAREGGLPDFTIWEENGEGKRVPDPARDILFPIRYVAPLPPNVYRLGCDLGSTAERRAVMMQAVRGNLATAGDPFPFPGEEGVAQAVRVYQPVWGPAPKRGLEGFAVAVIRVEKLLRNTVGGIGVLRLMDVATEFCEIRADHAPILLGSTQTGGHVKQVAPDANARYAREGLSCSIPIFAYGRAYAIFAYPTPSFGAHHPANGGLLTLAACLVLTLLGALFVDTVQRHRFGLEEQIRKRTYQLRVTRNQLEDTLRSIGDGVISCGVDGKVVRLNAVAEKLTGWNEAEAKGLPMARVFHLIDGRTRKPAEIPVERVMHENTIKALTNHSVLISRDKTERNIEDSCAPIHDGAGIVIGAVLVFRDVTDVYEQREALLETQQRFESIFRSNPSRMTLISLPERTFADVNDAFLAGTTLSREEVIGRPMLEIDLFPNLAEQKEIEKRLSEDGRISNYEHQVRTRNGEIRYGICSGESIKIHGKPYLLTIMVDITDRKRAEEELRGAIQLRAQAEGRAEMSAVVLHHMGNALTPVGIEVQGIMDADAQQTGDYLRNCYDDLKQHLNDMDRYIREDPRGQKVFSYMGRLIDSLENTARERTTSLEKVVKAFERMDVVLHLQQGWMEKRTNKTESLDINRLLDDFIRSRSSMFNEKGILVKQVFSPDLPSVRVDGERLLRVVDQLTQNSMESMEKEPDSREETQITFKTFQNNRAVGFEIGDTGACIHPGRIKALLQSEISGEDAMDLRLFFCRHFIVENGGQFEVKSVGKGTTVRVSFKMKFCVSEKTF